MSKEQLIVREADDAAPEPVPDCWEWGKKRLPILQWMPEYNASKCIQDVVAGVSVGLTEVPQAIAVATLASLPPQHGLYSGFMGCFVYAVLGSCKDVNIGPTVIMAVLTQRHVEVLGPAGSVLMAFLTGCVVSLMGLLNLGCSIRFFSYPVTAAFTSAASVHVVSTQLPLLLGIKKKAHGFAEAWTILAHNIKDTLLWDSLLGLVCLVVLCSMRELRRFGSFKNEPNWSRARNCVGRFCWILALARNALAVIVTTLMAYIFSKKDSAPFTLTGSLARGLPPFKLPDFTIEINDTTYSFSSVLSVYGKSLLFIPLVCILESVAVAKSFSKGKSVDATQEMLAVGVSNLLGSFVGSMPVTGSFTRTAVNNSSGVQTTFGGVFTGIMVLLSLKCFTNSFYYIPKATLAAVIICAMIHLFEREAIVVLWKTKKSDLIPFITTFLACLVLGLEYGILVGIATNLLFVLHTSMNPRIKVEKAKVDRSEVYIVTPMSARLYFLAAEYIRETVMLKCHPEDPEEKRRTRLVIIDGQHVTNLDATVAKNLKILADELKARDQSVVFVNFKESLKKTCTGVDGSMRELFRYGSIKEIIRNSV